MSNELVSIVIPIYKVEQYLPRCLESVIAQSYDNLEIILVDDGSPDNCPDICDQYARNDNRIKVIHKTNGGLSSARNAGISASNGLYICFIDSDDFVSSNYVKRLVELLEENQCDISVCRYISFNNLSREDDLMMAVQKNMKVSIYQGTNHIMNQFFNKNCGISVIAWNKMYKKCLFEGISFPDGRNYEDEATTYKLFYKSKSVIYTNESLYYYFQRSDSIMGSLMTERNLDAFISLEEVINFYSEHDEKRLENKAKIRYLKTIILYMIKNSKQKNSVRLKDELNKLYTLRITDISIVYKIYLRIYRAFKTLSS